MMFLLTEEIGRRRNRRPAENKAFPTADWMPVMMTASGVNLAVTCSNRLGSFTSSVREVPPADVIPATPESPKRNSTGFRLNASLVIRLPWYSDSATFSIHIVLLLFRGALFLPLPLAAIFRHAGIGPL